MRVFLCFHQDDSAFADELIAILHIRQYTVLTSKIHLSDDHWQRDILRSGVLLLLLSEASLDSEVCMKQWRYALAQGVRVLVLKLSHVEPPDELRTAQRLDYLDFVEIGRTIADGLPALRRDRYATEVTLKMLIVELADIAEQEKNTPRPQADSPATEQTRPPGMNELLKKQFPIPETLGNRVLRLLRRR